MIAYEEALKIISQNERQKLIKLPIVKSLNFIAGENIKSKVFVPPFNNSAMDGFAINASDIAKATNNNPIALRLTGRIMAGEKTSNLQGGALEIMTGAIVPANYDSVVKIEDVKIKENKVIFTSAVKLGDNIRQRGEDFKPGNIVVKKGELIKPSHIMALATIGQENILTYKKPKILLISTGKELTDELATSLLEGQIRNSNAPYILAALKKMGYSAKYGGIIRDNIEKFGEKIANSIEKNNLIISTGAVSMGKMDFIPDILLEMGAKILFHKVFIRPGKPILYARFANGTHYFGLPGNPISAAVGLRFFVLPLLAHIEGRNILSSSLSRPLIAKLEQSYPKKQGFRFFLKAKAHIDKEGGIKVKILSGQQSFKIHPLLEANCWASLSPKQKGERGEKVEIYPLISENWEL